MGSTMSSETHSEQSERKYEKSLHDKFPQTERYVTVSRVDGDDDGDDGFDYDTLCQYIVTKDKIDHDLVVSNELVVEYIIQNINNGKSYEICIDYKDKTFDIMLIIDEKGNSTFNDEYCDSTPLRSFMDDISIPIVEDNIRDLINALVLYHIPDAFLDKMTQYVMPSLTAPPFDKRDKHTYFLLKALR